jgi:hypothetical protein
MKKRGSVLSISGRDAPVNERLLSVKEAAEQLRVSTSWVYQSDIPRVKLGSRRLYRPVDLARYVNARLSHVLDAENES